MHAGEHCHVVKLPLRVDRREAAILRQRLRVRGQLRNAALQTLLARIERMRRDPRWGEGRRLAGKPRTRRYREIADEYGVSKRETCNAAFAHWRASKWMPAVVDSRVALELGTELWQQLSAWLHGRSGRPGFKPARATDTVWGADNHAGLCLRGQEIVWRNRKTPRKNLSLALACAPGQWRKRIEGRDVIRVGIRREEVRGQERWFALLCLRGEPYRDPDYLAQARRDALAGVDAGPSQLAVVSASGGERLDLSPPKLRAERQAERRRLRRRQRALDRSRRATNPGCFDGKGRWKQGHRATVRSRRYERRRRRQHAEARRARLQRRAEETRLARRIVSEHGAVIAHEALDYRSWQRSRYGRRIGFSAPGAALARISREAERVGGAVVRLDPALALSQHCLCGSRVKKELSIRIHRCESCGLGPLDRDLFSAFLACLVAKEGVNDLGTGTLNRAGTRRKAQALCAPGRAPVPARFGGRQADSGRLARKADGQTPRTRPARSRAGASRQATATGETQTRFAGPS